MPSLKCSIAIVVLRPLHIATGAAGATAGDRSVHDIQHVNVNMPTMPMPKAATANRQQQQQKQQRFGSTKHYIWDETTEATDGGFRRDRPVSTNEIECSEFSYSFFSFSSRLLFIFKNNMIYVQFKNGIIRFFLMITIDLVQHSSIIYN